MGKILLSETFLTCNQRCQVAIFKLSALQWKMFWKRSEDHFFLSGNTFICSIWHFCLTCLKTEHFLKLFSYGWLYDCTAIFYGLKSFHKSSTFGARTFKTLPVHPTQFPELSWRQVLGRRIYNSQSNLEFPNISQAMVCQQSHPLNRSPTFSIQPNLVAQGGGSWKDRTFCL